MTTVRLSRGCKISDSNVGKFCDFFIHLCDLRWKLSNMTNAKYLRLLYFRIHSKQRTNWKCPCFAWTILALGNQVDVIFFHWFCNHRNCGRLNFRRLEETKLLSDTSLNLNRDLKLFLVVPRLLLINERASYVFRELILGNSEFVERTRRKVKVGVTTRTGKCNF